MSGLLDETRGAEISVSGMYRYVLWRRFKRMGDTVLFVMLNPSTADATVDDPTIRRCLGFARRIDAAKLEVVNLYAFRATRPRDLWDAGDPIGPLNDGRIAHAIDEANVTIFAWGATPGPQKEERVESAWGSARRYGRTRPLCFGTTRDGSPRHPLYVREDSNLVDWSPT